MSCPQYVSCSLLTWPSLLGVNLQCPVSFHLNNNKAEVWPALWDSSILNALTLSLTYPVGGAQDIPIYLVPFLCFIIIYLILYLLFKTMFLTTPPPPPPKYERILDLACASEIVIDVLVLIFRILEVDPKCVSLLNVWRRKELFICREGGEGK